MRRNLSALFLLFFLLSCKSESSKHYDITYKKPVTVIDTLFMQMPGLIYYVNNHLIVEDALATDSFYKIYDTTGTFLKSIAPLGNSAIEFSTPRLTLLENDDLIVFDLNRGNAIIYKIEEDSLSQYTDLSQGMLKKNPLINLDDNIFLTINKELKSDVEELFFIYDKDSLVQSFGKYPIKEKIKNKFNAYHGALHYNKNNERLIYFSYSIPYCAIYKRSGNNFELLKEDTYAEYDYSIQEENLNIECDRSSIVYEVALLKDYIVTLGNTEDDLKKIPAPNGLGRDFNQLPRSLFIYDYDCKLIKVISLETPLLRIASNIDANLLYLATYIDGEFSLSKVEID